MNCDNDDLQRYCIGQHQCPYSIWGSLPFPGEMYEQVAEESAVPLRNSKSSTSFSYSRIVL